MTSQGETKLYNSKVGTSFSLLKELVLIQFQGHSKHFSKVGVSKRGCRAVGDEHASSPHCMTSLQVSSLTVHMHNGQRTWFAYKSIQDKETSLALACHAQNVFSIYNLSSMISILGTLTQY